MQKDTEVRLGHGSGGAMMKRLIDDLFLDEFSDEAALPGDDAGVVPLGGERIAMSTDSFVVRRSSSPVETSAALPCAARSTTWPPRVHR